MPHDSDDTAFLYDMVQSGAAIERYLTGRHRGDLDRDEMFRDALERRLEIFGEAARGVSAELQSRTPHIPWRKIIAVRHILAHDYDEINYDVLWQIVTTYVPTTTKMVAALLPPPPREDFTA